MAEMKIRSSIIYFRRQGQFPMNATFIPLLTGLILAAITAVITYFETLAKARLDLSIENKEKLRQKLHSMGKYRVGMANK
jgi:hypothetical protein